MRYPRHAFVTLFFTSMCCGCTSFRQYVHNGFKVGPNYCPPPAPVAKNWIDSGDIRVRKDSDDLSRWWTVFNDPVLNDLVCTAYQQNLSLRAAGFRVLQARDQLAVTTGNLFAQTQTMTGDLNRNAISVGTANSLGSFTGAKRYYQQADYGFNLSWELDFWGRFRRAIESDAASLDASAADYDDVLVTLLGDVATNYVNLRTFEQRIKYAKDNVKFQGDTLKIVEARFKAGTTTKLDLAQARSTLNQTEATIPELEISARQANNQLCILMGLPPEQLREKIGTAAIPTAPAGVGTGIPADLLRRRPDVRKAERQAAAQSAEIGVAEAEFYPHISLDGTLQFSSERFSKLLANKAFNGNIGPTFKWNILNYGRIRNNVLQQDDHLNELIATYQHTALLAAQEVENGIATFLFARQRSASLDEAVKNADEAVRIAVAQYEAGTVDFTRVTQLQTSLVELQDTSAQARGEIATGLVQIYRGMGGGWEIKDVGCPQSERIASASSVSTPQPAEPKKPTEDVPKVPKPGSPLTSPPTKSQALKLATVGLPKPSPVPQETTKPKPPETP